MLPAIAALLPSGLNLLANAALSLGSGWVEEKTGIDLNKAVLSPGELNKLAQFEMEHEEELLKIQQKDNQLEVELSKAYMADTQSARGMQETALESGDKFSEQFIYYFAIFWALFATIYITLITFMTIPTANVRFADTVLGFLLGTVVAQIIVFFYGSSKGSKDKTAALVKELQSEAG